MGAQGGDYWLVEVYAILLAVLLSALNLVACMLLNLVLGGTMFCEYGRTY